MIEMAAIAVAAVTVLFPSAVLSFLAAASLRRLSADAPVEPGSQRLVVSVLMAAHDEEQVISATLAAIAAVDRSVRVHVMADNCTDRTAVLAATASACVHERSDPHRTGKPAALNRLIAEVLKEDLQADAFAFIDADARPEPGFFAALRAAISRGADAVQARNLVTGSSAPLTRLRELAFHLKCELRPRAYASLGLSAGLHGNGMCLSRRLLKRYAWNERSVVEDGELHLRLVRDGVRVEFAPRATVRSPMPGTFRNASGQAVRWERGKVDLFPAAVRLLRHGFAYRRMAAVAAAYDALIPPLSVVIAASAAVTVGALAFGSAPLFAVGALSLVSCGIYITRGLFLARLRLTAMLGAIAWSLPYVSWKVVVLARTFLGAGRGQWTQARTRAKEVIG